MIATGLRLATVALLAVIAAALVALVAVLSDMEVTQILPPAAPSTQEFHVVPLDDITRKV